MYSEAPDRSARLGFVERQLDVLAGKPLLHVLVHTKNDNAVDALLRSGVSTEVRDDKGIAPLFVAVAYGHERIVQILLSHGADVYAKDPNNQYTPLHVMTASNHGPSSVSIFGALLDHGEASKLLFAEDNRGFNAFHIAAQSGNVLLLKEFLQVYHQMCTNSSSSSENIPSSSPLTSGSFAQNIVFNIRKTSQSLDSLRTKKGQTPLHCAAADGCTEAVNLLLQAGATKDVRDNDGTTPFYLASAGGNTAVLDLLAYPDCVSTVSTCKNLTPLHYATWTGRIDAVRWLVAHGAPLEAAETDNLTPLHFAALNGCSEVIQCLILEGGANPQQLTSPRGATPLGLADDFGFGNAARSLVRAIRLKGVESIKASLWTVHNSNGASLLHYFAAYGTEEDMAWILDLILSKTAYHHLPENPLTKRDDRGRTAMHWAAMRNNRDVVGLLVKNNTPLNAESNAARYKTPLSLAIIKGNMEFAEELMKCKPKASEADDWTYSIRTGMSEYYLDEEKNLQRNLRSLMKGFQKHANWTIQQGLPLLFFEMPPLYLALHAKRVNIAKFIQLHSQGVKDAVNETGELTGRTALHWATLLQQREIVA
ncbi:hypothetical protein L7F22_007422 [Adiantum nelumboides]|nr:hypothetical protein [Adiantum nelumboides]